MRNSEFMLRPEWNHDAAEVGEDDGQEQNSHMQPGDGGLLHGTAVLKYLVLPWAQTDRIVCADSYFASVGTLKELKRISL
jgi:hypothetical protein